MSVTWTHHAEQRLVEWSRRRGVTRDKVEDLVASPTQLVPGDLGTMVAQVRYGGGLLRVVFAEEADERRILTLYWTSRVERYWQG